MIIKDNMANMCAKVTSTYMEFTLAFGPKPEFSFSFKCLQSHTIPKQEGKLRPFTETGLSEKNQLQSLTM